MVKSDKGFLLTSTFVPKGLSAPALVLYTCIKALKYIPGPGVRWAFTGPLVLWLLIFLLWVYTNLVLYCRLSDWYKFKTFSDIDGLYESPRSFDLKVQATETARTWYNNSRIPLRSLWCHVSENKVSFSCLPIYFTRSFAEYNVTCAKNILNSSLHWIKWLSFVEICHEIIYMAILPLPLIQVGHLSVSGERMCTEY